MGKGRGKRSVLAQKAQTIEEIWESVSRTKSADLNPPPSKIVLTPRSAEACLRHGLNPEILRIRPLDSFDVKGVDPTVQRLRHETYTQRRFEMMRLVRAERKRLVAQEARDADLAAQLSALQAERGCITRLTRTLLRWQIRTRHPNPALLSASTSSNRCACF